MTLAIVVIVALVLTHAAALGAGGYLHYRFGARTVRAVKAVTDAVK